MAYNSFVPAVLPPNPQIELSDEIVEILVKANRQIALLEGISSRMPNIDLFILMYVRKEALGTRFYKNNNGYFSHLLPEAYQKGVDTLNKILEVPKEKDLQKIRA